MLFFEKRKVHQPECGQIPRQRGYPMFPTQIHEKINAQNTLFHDIAQSKTTLFRILIKNAYPIDRFLCF